MEDLIICSVNDQAFADRVITDINGKYGLDILGSSEVFKPHVFSSDEFDPNFLKIAKEVFLIAVSDPNISPGELMNRVISTTQVAYDVGAGSVHCIIPDLPFSRADKSPSEYTGDSYEKNKGRGRVALAQAKALYSAGLRKLFTVDIHSKKTERFYTDLFGDNFIHIDSNYLIAEHIATRSKDVDIVLIAPDKGIRQKTKDLLHLLNDKHNLKDVSAVYIEKTRKDANNPAGIMMEVDPDEPYSDNFTTLDGKTVFIMDDMIDTGGTFCAAASMIKDKGLIIGSEKQVPEGIIGCFTHPVLGGKGFEKPMKRLIDAGLTHLILFNTHPYIESSLPEELARITSIVDINEALAEEIITSNRFS